ncbi:MAG TPA: GNAT family N-acetyltransferase [Ohtaekwangia sp.]|nr:GNAT family N-acetyltransferase [Ohtaekwangia sp.]
MITYHHNKPISPLEFIDVLNRSTLSERRPVHDAERIGNMLKHANILVTAWHNDLLVGVSRAMSDFSFCCYLSDLAVDVKYQKQGIGKELIRLTHEVSGADTTNLILLAAPAATAYYPKIGMEQFTDCFLTRRKQH